MYYLTRPNFVPRNGFIFLYNVYNPQIDQTRQLSKFECFRQIKQGKFNRPDKGLLINYVIKFWTFFSIGPPPPPWVAHASTPGPKCFWKEKKGNQDFHEISPLKPFVNEKVQICEGRSLKMK